MLVYFLVKMAMSNAQKNSLVAKRVALINSVIPNEELCGYLRQANHITDSMEQELMVCEQVFI